MRVAVNIFESVYLRAGARGVGFQSQQENNASTGRLCYDSVVIARTMHLVVHACAFHSAHVCERSEHRLHQAYKLQDAAPPRRVYADGSQTLASAGLNQARLIQAAAL